jgi:dTDP-4-dehydrorhamnose reductase
VECAVEEIWEMRVVLTGSSGQLGSYLVDRLLASGYELRAWSGTETGTRGGCTLLPVDLADVAAIDRALAEADPEVIVHAAAISTAEAVRRDPARAQVVNVEATARLAGWCRRKDRRLLFTSTDLVFDGSGSWYREDDEAQPILAYGQTKRAVEPAILAVPRGLVARLSLLYGPARAGRPTYFDRTVAGLRAGQPQTFFEDEFRTALDYATAAAILTRLVASDATGLLHVAGRERVSRYELARRIASALGLDPRLVGANRQADAASAEPRPADVSLDTTRLTALFPDLARPTIEEAVTGVLPVTTRGASPG